MQTEHYDQWRISKCVFENTGRCIKMQELKLRMTLCHSFMEVKIQQFSVIPEFDTLFFLVSNLYLSIIILSYIPIFKMCKPYIPKQSASFHKLSKDYFESQLTQ